MATPLAALLDLSRAGDRLLVLLLDASLKAAVVLAAAALLALLLRRAPARARHQLWCAALGAALLLPAVAPLVPAWPGLPAPLVRPAIEGRPARQTRPAAEVTMTAAPEAGGGSEKPAALGSSSALVGPALVQTPPQTTALAGSAPRPAPEPPATARPAGRAGGVPAGWPRWALLAWAAGAALVLAFQLTGLWQVRRLARRAPPLVDEGWGELLGEVRRRVELSRDLRLAESPVARSAMTLGWRRPVVLLPPGWRGWSPERRRIVLLHEAVHVRRGDWPVRILLRLTAALYWPSPLTWVALRRLTLEQERACDDEVVALGVRPSTYAAHLLQMTRAMRPRATSPRLGFPYPALEMARRSQMEGRLMSILDAPRANRKPFYLPALALVAGLALSLAAVKPWTVAEASPQTPSPAAAPANATADLPRTLAELQRLEAQLQPYEDQLETMEGELEPLEEQLEAIEVEMAPVEERLEQMEEELEPYEERMEAVEAQASAHEERMEAAEREMEPFESRIEELEARMEPYEARMEQIEEEMTPLEDQLDALEEQMEPVEEEMEELGEQLEALHEAGDHEAAAALEGRLRELAARLEPVHRQMQSIHEQMRPFHDRMRQVHDEMQPLYEQMRQIHEEMGPHHERMGQIHEEMRPHHQAMEGIHREMEPVYRRMEEVHREMEPFHRRMEEVHRQMEPVHRRMGEVHRQMEPLHQEMHRLHDQLHQGLRREVRGLLESELGAGVSSEAVDRATGRILDAASIQVEDGRLRLRTSGAEVREILQAELGAAATEAAAESAVRALGDFQVAATETQR